MSFPRFSRYKDSGVKWLGEVPEHWAIIPLWTLYRRTKRTGFPDEELLSVYRDHGVVPKSSRDDNNNNPSDDLSTYQLVEPGDLVINKMKAWQGSVSISRFRGIVSPAYFVYESRNRHSERFLNYLMRSERYITGYLSLSKGIRIGQWDLDPDYHSRMPVLIPNRNDQETIAHYLDSQIRSIDALVEEQRRLIELLKEKRQAVISHAVTKGIDPKVPTKQSGNEYVGDIPRHWTMQKLSALAAPDRNSFVNGPFGSDLLTSELTDTGVPVIYIRDIREIGYSRVSECFVTTEKALQLVFCNVIPGDLIIAKVGDPPGVAAVYPDGEPEGIVTQDVIRIRVNLEIACPEYLRWLLNSKYGQSQIDLISVESTRTRIALGEYKQLRFVLPPKEEQSEIAEFLNREAMKFDSLAAEASKVIDLLQERRSALISAAVTGKIDVRQAVLEPVA